jgi:hypothetical protein
VTFHLGVQQGAQQKGTLAVASDADLVVLDPERTWTDHADDLHMRADYSCWEGWGAARQGRDDRASAGGCSSKRQVRWATDGGRFLERRLPDEIPAFESQFTRVKSRSG